MKLSRHAFLARCLGGGTGGHRPYPPRHPAPLGSIALVVGLAVFLVCGLLYSTWGLATVLIFAPGFLVVLGLWVGALCARRQQWPASAGLALAAWVLLRMVAPGTPVPAAYASFCMAQHGLPGLPANASDVRFLSFGNEAYLRFGTDAAGAAEFRRAFGVDSAGLIDPQKGARLVAAQQYDALMREAWKQDPPPDTSRLIRCPRSAGQEWFDTSIVRHGWWTPKSLNGEDLVTLIYDSDRGRLYLFLSEG